MSTATQPVNDKQSVLDVVNRFSDSASFEEIADEVALHASLRRGIAELDAGLGISNEEAKQRTAQCLIR